MTLYNTSLPKLNRVVEILTNNFLNSSNVLIAESVLDQLMELKHLYTKDNLK